MIAIVSTESFESEIVQRVWPGRGVRAKLPVTGGGKRRISTEGGDQPYWRDGGELYYLAPDLALTAVPIRRGNCPNFADV